MGLLFQSPPATHRLSSGKNEARSALAGKLPARWLRAFPFAVAFILAFVFFSHPDLWETSAHSYLLLDSIFAGHPLDFYNRVAAHQNSFYYINNANYNIVIYCIFAAWQLPVYLAHTLFGAGVSDLFLFFWSKCVSVGFFIGCGIMLRRLACLLGFSPKAAGAAALFFIFDPVAFFSPMVLGQYDTLCLFFTLWALCFYVRGQYTRFSLVLGVGVVCKFFPLLLFVPLILLAEKRPTRLPGYAACTLWLYLPTTLLYHGRTGDAPVFTQAMIDRLFRLNYETGVRGVSVFVLGYALLVFAALLYAPPSPQRRCDVALYCCLAVYGWLFLCLLWHPQWVLLFTPFAVLTSCRHRVRLPWFLLDLAFCAGFFLNCFYEFPNQMGAGLLDGGLLPLFAGRTVAGCGESWKLLSNFLEHIPYVWVMTPVLFCGAILAQLLFKIPFSGGTPAQRLTRAADDDTFSLWGGCGLRFALGFGCCWLLPVLAEALTAYGVISYPFT